LKKKKLLNVLDVVKYILIKKVVKTVRVALCGNPAINVEGSYFIEYC
jgi:hypothetical protein